MLDGDRIGPESRIHVSVRQAILSIVKLRFLKIYMMQFPWDYFLS
ncbi:hypothetical protein CBFG_00540 [Clostridiales bacterium 1_7_47FAA]|nr:hypothetical protein CBFG_00540 [Clostridiales bacterium 1_7_47FAA]